MSDSKENKKNKQIKSTEEPVGKIKINPNPAANANVDKDKAKEKNPDKGVGSEITDGEGG